MTNVRTRPWTWGGGVSGGNLFLRLVSCGGAVHQAPSQGVQCVQLYPLRVPLGHCTLWRFAWHPMYWLLRRQAMSYRSAQATDILLPRWHQQGAPEVMLHRSAEVTDILPRWHQQRAPEVMLYRSAQATDILLPRWHQQRAPEVMLYRSAQVSYTFLPRWHQQRAPEVMLYRRPVTSRVHWHHHPIAPSDASLCTHVLRI